MWAGVPISEWSDNRERGEVTPRKRLLKKRQQSNFFHAHAHSNFSPLDGMSDVEKMVAKAAADGQPAMALTDHGLMSGCVQLYKACQKHGIKPFPGIEAYLIDPDVEDWETPEKGERVGRYHLCLLALSEAGYKALVRFSSKTHTRPRFNRFPRCTVEDLEELGEEAGEDIAILTGCYFGLVQQTLLNKGCKEALAVVRWYMSMFANTFVELQHHNIVHDNGKDDDWLVGQMFDIAQELSLPVIATQDCHYLDEGDKVAHETMKKMTYGGDDNEFPGDCFHLATGKWVRGHYTDEVWELCEKGYERLLGLNDVRIAPLDTFKPDLPRVKGVKDPDKYMTKECDKAFAAYIKTKRLTSAKRREYSQRLNEELGIIQQLSMSGYFVIWREFVHWCRAENIAIEARGSANGSLVCFLLGITQVDPLIYDTRFARFLSTDRIKPPDIDLDIEDAERPRAVHHMLNMYTSVQIGTFGKLGVTFNEEGEETGSVFRSWQSWKRRECEQIALERWEAGKLGKKGDVKAYGRGVFTRKYGDVTEIAHIKNVSPTEYEGIRRIESMGNVYKSYGVHAGGVLLSGSRYSIDDYVPTMLVASSNTRVSQYDMDDVEKFGFLKMDLLGQASLTVMKRTMALIDPDFDPTDFTWIEEDDSKTCLALRCGRTGTGIFHQEGWTKSRGWKELGVRNTNDAILGQALYMPGCMDVAPGQSISMKDLYLKRRKDPKERRKAEYLNEVFQQVLSPTYGAVIYQEQVIDIMRGLGMDIAGINQFFAVVKDSGRGSDVRNAQRMEDVRSQFDELCESAGIDPDEAWNQTASFVAYGFNRAHASAYGIRSYRSAYLKTHYPLEYMTGLLQVWSGRDKEAMYIKEARRVGIRILPPDVNVSGATWTMDNDLGAIRKGLGSIRGVGDTTAVAIAAGAPYESVEHMIEALPARVVSGGKQYLADGSWTGILGKLRDAGALESIIN
jgi:DNA polymerase-3 subunit alpha